MVVSDTSPISYLTILGRQDLLHELFDKVAIPRAVARELAASGAPAAARELVASPPEWLEVRTATAAPGVGLEALQPGELEAIVLAEEIRADMLLLDDRAARQVATRRGLTVTGLLGVLLEGANRGLVDLPEAIQRLRQTKFRASPHLLQSVLSRLNPPQV